MGAKCLKKLVLGRKKAKIERVPSTKSPLARLTTAKPRPFPPPQTSFSARRAPLFRLISLHERRSRNMTARIVGHFRPPFRLISPHERRIRNMTARIGGRFRPPLRLISLHERRSRNMMARVVRRELSVLSNLIRTVKRSPKTSFQQPFVPQTLPPGRTLGRRGGASMVSLPSAGSGACSGEYERGRSSLPKRRLSAGC